MRRRRWVLNQWGQRVPAAIKSVDLETLVSLSIRARARRMNSGRSEEWLRATLPPGRSFVLRALLPETNWRHGEEAGAKVGVCWRCLVFAARPDGGFENFTIDLTTDELDALPTIRGARLEEALHRTADRLPVTRVPEDERVSLP